MADGFDVVIAGGAIVGSSTRLSPGRRSRLSRPRARRREGFFLRESGDVAVAEFGPPAILDAASTSASASPAWPSSDKRRRRSPSRAMRPTFRLTENGYLYLASDAGAEVLRDNHVAASGRGRQYRVVGAERDRGALSLPQSRGRDARLARACRAKAGSTAISCMQAFRRKARSRKARSIARTRSSRSSATARALRL